MSGSEKLVRVHCTQAGRTHLVLREKLLTYKSALETIRARIPRLANARLSLLVRADVDGTDEYCAVGEDEWPIVIQDTKSIQVVADPPDPAEVERRLQLEHRRQILLRYARPTSSVHTAMANEQITQPAVKGEEPNAPINLKVVYQDSPVGADGPLALTFKVKPTMSFHKIFDVVTDRLGKEKGSLRFMYDGARVHLDKTPAIPHMQDGDQIDVHDEQLGGNAKS